MRISGGIIKGRKIKTRKAFSGRGELRPTSSKVRQAIFNILQDKITDALFLDLYAGTGAVGLEALSRGAKMVFFVDENPLRIESIKKIVEDLGFKDRVFIFKDDALRFLKRTDKVFDIIFVDPPYESEDLDLVIPLVSEKGLLKERGLLIAEHSSKKRLMDCYRSLRLVKTYIYGDTALSLYKKEEHEDSNISRNI